MEGAGGALPARHVAPRVGAAQARALPGNRRESRPLGGDDTPITMGVSCAEPSCEGTRGGAVTWQDALAQQLRLCAAPRATVGTLALPLLLRAAHAIVKYAYGVKRSGGQRGGQRGAGRPRVDVDGRAALLLAALCQAYALAITSTLRSSAENHITNYMTPPGSAPSDAAARREALQRARATLLRAAAALLRRRGASRPPICRSTEKRNIITNGTRERRRRQRH